MQKCWGIILWIRIWIQEQTGKLLHKLKKRLGDLKKRGVVLKPGQTLKDLLEYRTPYYEKYAHVVVDEEDMDIRGVVETITSLLEEA